MQLMDPRLPFIIPECLFCIRVPWRCVVHSCGFGQMYNEVHPVPLAWKPPAPLVHTCPPPCVKFPCDFSLLQACTAPHSFQAVLSPMHLQSMGPALRPHTWAASHSPCVDTGCTLGERHRRSPHPTSPRPDTPSSWGPPVLLWLCSGQGSFWVNCRHPLSPSGYRSLLWAPVLLYRWTCWVSRHAVHKGTSFFRLFSCTVPLNIS